MKIMGILNVTPDSFSDGGKNYSIEDALLNAREMVSEGVDIIDVGGESTRPGSDAVSVKEELDRVIPVIEKLSKLEVQISVDTYKLEVAEKAVEAGATMINDVYGLRQEGMLELVSNLDVEVCIMHMQGTPKSMQNNPSYIDVVSEIKDFFKQRIKDAVSHGVREENIILDPGIGFGKTLEQNLEVLRNLSSFKDLGYPLLVGHSKKRFLGDLLGVDVSNRSSPTLIVSTYLAQKGVDILRVHDVKEHVEMKRILDSI